MPWDFISVSAYAEVSSGNLTLNAPASAQQNDLLVACIAYRSNVAFTPNDSAWQLVASQRSSGDTDATQGIASGVMYYCIRGASNPGLQFNRTLGDVAQGTILCYRGVNQVIPYWGGGAATLGSIGEPALTGLSSVPADALLVAMISHGDNSLCSAVDAVTDPSTASGNTDTSTEPTAGTWIERFDRGSNTGADTGLCVADGVKSSLGDTGNFSADAATTTRSVFIVGVFRFATIYTETLVSIGISASGLLALQQFVNILNESIQSVGSVTDIKHHLESLLSQISSQSTVLDKQSYVESLLSEISSASNIEDFKGVSETLSATAISQSDLLDYQMFVNIILTTIQSSESLTDIRHYLEDILSQISSQSAVAAIQGYLETLIAISSSIASLSDYMGYVETITAISSVVASIADFMDYVETLSSIASSSEQISELMGYMEQVQTVIASASSVVDVIEGNEPYVENLLSTFMAVATVEDRQAFVDNLQTLISAQAGLLDLQQYSEIIQTIIAGGSSIIDSMPTGAFETLISTIVSKSALVDFYGKYIKGDSVLRRIFETATESRLRDALCPQLSLTWAAGERNFYNKVSLRGFNDHVQ